jgi:hypothetical protein
LELPGGVKITEPEHPKALRDLAMRISCGKLSQDKVPLEGSSVEPSLLTGSTIEDRHTVSWQWSSWKGRLSRDEV